MQSIINEIDNYIKYLISKYGLHISMHPLVQEGVIMHSKLRIYNISPEQLLCISKKYRRGPKRMR